jgi:predicted nucleotidyltransferase
MDKEHEKLLDKVLTKIQAEIPGIIAIVLFGTFGTEYETAQSDLDIALLSKGKLDPVFLWNLAQEIAREVRRDVDLIDLCQASTVFRVHILASGQVLFCADEYEFGQFDTTSFSMYFHLQEMRKGILEDYEKRRLQHG